MAYSISSACISCNACKVVCPNNAIKFDQGQYSVISHRCDECQAHYEHPQCASICPVEGAILDAQGLSLVPEGSLAALPEVAATILQRPEQRGE